MPMSPQNGTDASTNNMASVARMNPSFMFSEVLKVPVSWNAQLIVWKGTKWAHPLTRIPERRAITVRGTPAPSAIANMGGHD